MDKNESVRPENFKNKQAGRSTLRLELAGVHCRASSQLDFIKSSKLLIIFKCSHHFMALLAPELGEKIPMQLSLQVSQVQFTLWSWFFYEFKKSHWFLVCLAFVAVKQEFWVWWYLRTLEDGADCRSYWHVAELYKSTRKGILQTFKKKKKSLYPITCLSQ